ncbi:MAG TPA: AzlC family ABC transporter permease [Usitatibacter sp.]|jgi:predicted branched-subunit amino acid permease|nr:AzlC family ABC transporter permease [Usitatibacter sp.]
MRSQREEFAAGAREISPMIVGMVPFGLVAGVAATASGLTPAQGIALSVLSFSGIAQLIVCQLLAAKSPGIVVVAAGSIVSLRFAMYSAAVSPHLAHLDRRWRALLAFLMTDQSFAMTTARFSAPGDRSLRHWHTLGASLTLYVAWQAVVIAGIVVGAQVPARWSLDFAVVLTFIALLVPAVRTRADLAAAIVAAATALVAAGLPYRLSLVAASLAGIAAGMAIERSRRRRGRNE